MEDLQKLQEEFSRADPDLIADIRDLDGDIMILGAGGKMGPGLALLAKKALQKAGRNNRITGVSRFSDPSLKQKLEQEGIHTIQADLLDEHQLNALPEARNIIFMAGTKFGTTGNESFTWAMNAYLPGRVAEKFKNSRIVVFSSGNIYPFVPVISGGATEETLPAPVGEYAQSCLGRERIFEHFSKKYQTPVLIFRLNYAVDFRYGVLQEIARSVLQEKEIDLSTGHVNVIWQGDANAWALRSLKWCDCPPKVLNITGPETVSVRWAAESFGKIFNKKPLFINAEQPEALLSNASPAHLLYGYPKVPLKKMMDILSIWLTEGGEVISKPTHFQERKGSY